MPANAFPRHITPLMPPSPGVGPTILVLTLCIGTAVGTDQLGYTYILGAFLAAAFLPSPVLDPLGDEGKAALIRAAGAAPSV